MLRLSTLMTLALCSGLLLSACGVKDDLYIPDRTTPDAIQP